MRPRIAEVRRVAELLQQPAEDAEELAAKIIGELDAMRVERKGYVLVVKQGDPIMTVAFGPYPTPLQARKAITSGKVIATSADAWGIICSLVHPEGIRNE